MRYALFSEGAARDRRRLCRRLLPHAASVGDARRAGASIITLSAAETIGGGAASVPGLHRVDLPLLRPESRGFVRIKSADPRRRPAIQPRTICRRRCDRDTVVAGLKLLRRIMRAAGDGGATSPRSACRARNVTSDADLLDVRARGRHHGLSSDQHLPHGRRMPMPSSTSGCACAASSDLRVVDAYDQGLPAGVRHVRCVSNDRCPERGSKVRAGTRSSMRNRPSHVTGSRCNGRSGLFRLKTWSG